MPSWVIKLLMECYYVRDLGNDAKGNELQKLRSAMPVARGDLHKHYKKYVLLLWNWNEVALIFPWRDREYVHCKLNKHTVSWTNIPIACYWLNLSGDPNSVLYHGYFSDKYPLNKDYNTGFSSTFKYPYKMRLRWTETYYYLLICCGFKCYEDYTKKMFYIPSRIS